MSGKMLFILFGIALVAAPVSAGEKKFVEFSSMRRNIDVSKVGLNDNVWKTAAPYKQPLQRQFLVDPKPADVGVKEVLVQSVHDGKYIAFRLVWKDAARNDNPKIMNFSDSAALQFPVKKSRSPSILWESQKSRYTSSTGRAWRSADRKHGFQTVKTAYPNMVVDLYQFDYPVQGKGTEKTQAEKDIFIPGKAAGNPLPFPIKRSSRNCPRKAAAP